MSKKRIHKKVVNGYVPTAIKKPYIIENPESYFSQMPRWSFSKCDKEHKKWSVLSYNDFNTRIIPKLISLESRTWGDIENDKTHNHWISCNKLTKEAQDRLIKMHYNDIDEVFSLHLEGKLRLFGIIYYGVYYIIWIDEEHAICPSLKKHT